MNNPVSFDEYLSKEMENPAFHAEWNAQEPEFQIVRAIMAGREARKFNNEQLSEKTGIAPADLYSLETGTGNPTLSTLKRLADGLGMTLRLDFQPRV